MKAFNLKIWPEISGYLPAVTPWRRALSRSNDIYIDFSNCTTVSSASLTIILIRLVKLFQKGNMTWDSNQNNENPILERIIGLNFFTHLASNKAEKSIFMNEINFRVNEKKLIYKNEIGQLVNSFPIFSIPFSGNKEENRRASLSMFKIWINDLLNNYVNEYDFNKSQLILILNEIVKNSADHTDYGAFVGFDVMYSIDMLSIEISFVIGDVGVGINQNIKESMAKIVNRYDNWDLTQTYRWALSTGTTTQTKSILNKGIGMSIILDGSKRINLDLSVFDADSRGILTNIKSITHEEIRKQFYNIGIPVGFFYYGKLTAQRI